MTTLFFVIGDDPGHRHLPGDGANAIPGCHDVTGLGQLNEPRADVIRIPMPRDLRQFLRRLAGMQAHEGQHLLLASAKAGAQRGVSG
jgi:hypothetical protein